MIEPNTVIVTYFFVFAMFYFLGYSRAKRKYENKPYTKESGNRRHPSPIPFPFPFSRLVRDTSILKPPSKKKEVKNENAKI